MAGWSDAELRAQLDAGVRALKLDLSPEVQQRLLDYRTELEKWNAAYNLTAVRSPSEMISRHLLDSLTVLPLVRGRVLDVGAGAGLPGLVLAIANPELQVTVLDSNGKKARFMRHAQRHLKLENAQVAESRAQDWQAPGYDVVVSRAYADLSDFFQSTAHLLAPGGQWLAMKGKLAPAELAAVPAAVTIRETHRLLVPGLKEDRHAVLATPEP